MAVSAPGVIEVVEVARIEEKPVGYLLGFLGAALQTDYLQCPFHSLGRACARYEFT